MMDMNQELPITALCIVSECGKCPANYKAVAKSHDTLGDIDLWKDGLFGRKINRYICFTKDYPINDTYNVVEDIKILNEQSNLLNNYIPVDKCADTSEKAFQKKILCIKVSPRFYTPRAVSDIVVLVRSKRAPTNYTYLGEINGHSICIKFSPVVPLANPATGGQASVYRSPSLSSGGGASTPSPVPPPRPPNPSATENGSNNSAISFQYSNGGEMPANGVSNTVSSQSRSGGNHLHQAQLSSSTTYNPLYGVPFEINPFYDVGNQHKANSKREFDIEELNIKSNQLREDLKELDYEFKFEKSCLQELENKMTI